MIFFKNCLHVLTFLLTILLTWLMVPNSKLLRSQESLSLTRPTHSTSSQEASFKKGQTVRVKPWSGQYLEEGATQPLPTETQ